MTQELNERVIPFGEAVDTLRSFIHDPAGDVQTDSGPMPNLRKIHEELRHSGAVATVTEGVKTVQDGVQIVLTQGAYPTVNTEAEGIAATASTPNKFFKIFKNGPSGLKRTTIFENVAGVSMRRDDIVASEEVAAEVDARRRLISEEVDRQYAVSINGQRKLFPTVFVDQFNQLLAGVGPQEAGSRGLTIPLATMHGMFLGQDDEVEVSFGSFNYDLVFVDVNDVPFAGMLNGKWYSLGDDGDAAPTALIEAARARAAAVRDRTISGIPSISHKYNVIVGNGQSLGTANETWPRKSKTQIAGNLMLGQSLRPQGVASNTFLPVGSSAFYPLVATHQSNTDGSQLNDEQTATLPTGDNARGETPLEGACNGLKRLFCDKFGLPYADVSRQLVAAAVGISGRTIEALSKGHPAGAYGRYTSALAQIKAIADAQAQPSQILATLPMQGEYNSDTTFGAATSEADYGALQDAWFNDMQIDGRAIFGQPLSPAVFIYQTSMGWVKDAVLAGVPMAQLKAALNRRDVWMVGPSYPYTDKGGHFDANGVRWFGNVAAKVMHRVLVERKDWKPVHPFKVEMHSRWCYVLFLSLIHI